MAFPIERSRMRTSPRRLIVWAGLVFAAALASQCMSKPAATAAATPAAPSLDSSLAPTLSVKELMEHIIDPTADWIFDAAVIDISHKGVSETKPLTDEDWLKVERGGYLLAESTNLLKIPRRMVPVGRRGSRISRESPNCHQSRSKPRSKETGRSGTNTPTD
jgi:hypothetical protein